jgi:DNA-binding XRE family transcriptional regulator
MSSPLAAFRHRHLLTQEQAAKAVAVSVSTWTQLERCYRGRRPAPSLLTLLEALDRLRRHNIPWPHEDEDDDGQDD